MVENIENNIVLIVRSVDSLYLYLDCSGIFKMENIIDCISKYQYDESFKFMNVDFIRLKEFFKSYPYAIKTKQYIFYLNRQSIYIKVLSLAFELRGYEGTILEICEILNRMVNGRDINWLDKLKVSRIDVYIDFGFNGDFNFNQFRSRLKKRGIWKNSHDAESVTYYFGNRSVFMVRLYVKSSEIQFSGKSYLRSSWELKNCEKVWRLEFEYHKEKILEVCQYRELSCIDKNAINKLFSYGMNNLEYVDSVGKDGNLEYKKLHPVWQCLKNEFNAEYNITRKEVKNADIEFRKKRARRWVISYMVAKEIDFDNIPQVYISDYNITRYDYEKERRRFSIDYKRNRET